MATNFRDLLSDLVETAEKPKAKPAGTYSGIIASFKFDESSKKKTPFVRLMVKNISPGADVDQAALAAAGDITRWSPYQDYYLTDDAKYRLRELMESCRMNIAGRSFQATIPELVNQPVILTVVQETVTNEQTGEVNVHSKINSMKGA